MKTRKGFVSNSSSSSFIVQWKYKNEEKDVMRALLDLFEISYVAQGEIVDISKEIEYKKDVNDFNWKFFEHLKLICEEIVKHTKIKGDIFETEFFTIMRNDVTDYGRAAMAFIMALTINNAEKGKGLFEIVHMRTED